MAHNEKRINKAVLILTTKGWKNLPPLQMAVCSLLLILKSILETFSVLWSIDYE